MFGLIFFYFYSTVFGQVIELFKREACEFSLFGAAVFELEVKVF